MKINIVSKKNMNWPKADFNICIHRPMPNCRGSVLGNPFKVKPYGEFTLEDSLDRYQSWLGSNLCRDPRIKEEYNKIKKLVKSGKDINLVCFCSPKPCHGDIIKEWIQIDVTTKSRKVT